MEIDTPTKPPAMWNFAAVWNQSLDVDTQRPYEKREHVWASELTGSYYDRYWKMKGRQPTTPPNLRARRKFEGGNMAEFVMKSVLQRAGILRSSQEYITNDEFPARVTGKADFTAGGEVQSIREEDLEGLPETFIAISQRAIEHLKEKYPEGLKFLNVEIKSVSAIMFDSYASKPGTHHALQAFHYAYNTDRPTLLVYVCRDDYRLCDWVVMPDNKTYFDIYVNDLTNMAKVLKLNKKQIAALKEPLLVWDEDEQKFKKNFKVEYSAYLTDYGFEQPSDYAEPAGKIAGRINNVLKRLREGKKLSKLNDKAIEDTLAFYPKAEERIVKAINEWHVTAEPEPKKEKKGKKK